jgi:hypothetical protein
MARKGISIKHLQINKASSTITATLAVAAFLTVAGLVGSRAMLQQRSYQAKVIAEKELAAQTLKTNIDSVNTLVVSYKEFVGRPQNIIGGNSQGTGERDGDNAKLVLDALPSTYDFPALASSLEKILTQGNFKINSITGTDDEVAQSATQAAEPTVVDMPFAFSVEGNYDQIFGLITTLERSIRPLKIGTMNISVDDGGVSLDISGVTHYQSAKGFNVTTKVVE